MTWDDVEDILYEGTEEQIKTVKCPDCGGPIFHRFYPKTRNFERGCNECGLLIRGHGSDVPNCSKYEQNV